MQDLKAIKARAQSIGLGGPDSKTSGPQTYTTTTTELVPGPICPELHSVLTARPFAR